MINVRVRINKSSFKGWIQDNLECDKTIQNIEVEQNGSCCTLDFECIEEWQKFIDFFNVTEITDMREKS